MVTLQLLWLHYSCYGIIATCDQYQCQCIVTSSRAHRSSVILIHLHPQKGTFGPFLTRLTFQRIQKLLSVHFESIIDMRTFFWLRSVEIRLKTHILHKNY